MVERDDNTWWGDYALDGERVIRWRIGPLSLWAQRLAGEWRLAWRSSGDPLQDGLELAEQAAVDDILALENAARYAVRGDDGQLQLSAALADRTVVTRAEQPVNLLPGEDLYVYVSTPLWVRVAVGRPARKLVEIPVLRLSDTWFGDTTMEGELGYSARSRIRLDLDNVPARPHRATTAVRVKNRAADVLTLERLKIPVVHLALCQAEDGRLWTHQVVYERTETSAFATLHMPDRAEQQCIHGRTRGRLLAPPRQEADANLVMRAFSSLLRLRES
jgi:hypothetical protein